jgi:hypothetical protein
MTLGRKTKILERLTLTAESVSEQLIAKAQFAENLFGLEGNKRWATDLFCRFTIF